MISASERFHTDRTCLILALHWLAQLRCLPMSYLDHRRLQANKLRTSMSNQTTQIVGSYHGIFQNWTYFPGTGYYAMAINPIVAQLNFLLDNITYILRRQHVVYMYLSFECRQCTIRWVRVTFDGVVLYSSTTTRSRFPFTPNAGESRKCVFDFNNHSRVVCVCRPTK